MQNESVDDLLNAIKSMYRAELDPRQALELLSDPLRVFRGYKSVHNSYFKNDAIIEQIADVIAGKY